MEQIHHLNCLKIISPITDNVIGHCMLLQDDAGSLALIDTGLGLLDTHHPQQRIGQQLIDLAGFRFNENITAIKQIENLGLHPADVKDCILSHLDPDHAGGLADFPDATVHVSKEEYKNFHSGNPRYLVHQLAHNPVITQYGYTGDVWFGFEARKVQATIQFEILLIPLFGHTKGHCGIAINYKNQWIFYVADAYYLQEELDETTEHPVSELAKLNADDNDERLQTLNHIRQLKREHPEIIIFCYHDAKEFKSNETNI